MWECDWDHKVKPNHDLKQLLASYKLVDPPTPGDLFFGSRTNALRLYHEVDETVREKIKHVDVTSLYP